MATIVKIMYDLLTETTHQTISSERDKATISFTGRFHRGTIIGENCVVIKLKQKQENEKYNIEEKNVEKLLIALGIQQDKISYVYPSSENFNLCFTIYTIVSNSRNNINFNFLNENMCTAGNLEILQQNEDGCYRQLDSMLEISEIRLSFYREFYIPAESILTMNNDNDPMFPEGKTEVYYNISMDKFKYKYSDNLSDNFTKLVNFLRDEISEKIRELDTKPNKTYLNLLVDCNISNEAIMRSLELGSVRYLVLKFIFKKDGYIEIQDNIIKRKPIFAINYNSDCDQYIHRELLVDMLNDQQFIRSFKYLKASSRKLKDSGSNLKVIFKRKHVFKIINGSVLLSIKDIDGFEDFINNSCADSSTVWVYSAKQIVMIYLLYLFNNQLYNKIVDTVIEKSLAII